MLASLNFKVFHARLTFMDPFLLILACVAGFILFRLFSVLGTRTGHEQTHDFEPLAPAPREAEATASVSLDDAPATPVSTNARVLRDADPSFDEGEFLNGARGAYELIVEAFAAGDVRGIRKYLSDAVYDAFKTAAANREDAGQTMELKFVGIDHAAIVDASVKDGALSAVTEFSSNQVRVTRDKDGNVIEGDANRIDLVKDRWTFARKIRSSDPNWVLVATGGA